VPAPARRYSACMSEDIDIDALAEAYDRGLAAEKAGDIPAAVAAYRAALAIDAEDRGGVAVRLAALGQGPAPEAAPPAHVATLFDQHAERFEAILVDQLGYDVPQMLPALLDAHGIDRVGRLLDLGCGTGLAGAALADRTAHLTGCDLSEGMLAIADDRAIYDDLYLGEAVAFLETWDEAPFDLIVAADMLPYLGVVEGLFAAAAAALVPGGHLAFSTETLPETAFAGRGYTVGPHQRFAHAESHLRDRLAAAGFELRAMRPITVRRENAAAVPGQLILARRRSQPPTCAIQSLRL